MVDLKVSLRVILKRNYPNVFRSASTFDLALIDSRKNIAIHLAWSTS